MNETNVRTVRREAGTCALAMLENATFIENELPNVQMDGSTRAATLALCSQLVGTKHDIFHELHELDDLIDTEAGEDRITRKAAMIVRWLGQDVTQMQELVTTLEAAAAKDSACQGAYILVAESAGNILAPFDFARAALDKIAAPH